LRGASRPAGAINRLAQTLLKLTAPGVLDIYQGTDFWDLSLVDPDNRRPVDFQARLDALSAQAPITELARNWHNGRVKQAVIRRGLAVRRVRPELFVPLAVEPAADHVIAFVRRQNGAVALTVACRLPARLLGANDGIVIPASALGRHAAEPPARAGRNENVRCNSCGRIRLRGRIRADIACVEQVAGGAAGSS
jgi:(1->4)-alpha-D-glucan 1-alpha-D-glucosylmutase